MTVCIAVASRYLKRIVTISDKKLSGQHVSVDDAIAKAHGLTRDGRWGCMFSAPDMASVEPLLRRADERLYEHDDAYLPDVELAIEGAYADERRHIAEVTILSPFGVDLKTFDAEGYTRYGAEIFQRTRDAISATNPGVQLLVFGFDPSGLPHIFSTSTIGQVFSSDAFGFDAIGSGNAVAFASLCANAEFIRRSVDLGEVVYRVCEAKFASEMSEGVGRNTIVASFEEDGVITIVHDDSVNAARATYERRRRAKLPERLLNDLRRGLSFDRTGAQPIETAKTRYVEESRAYERVMQTLVALRAQQHIDDDGWQEIVRLQKTVAQLSTTVRDQLDAWERTEMMPDGYRAALVRLGGAVLQLQEIARVAEGLRGG